MSSSSPASFSRSGSTSQSRGLVKGQGCLPWTQRHADIVTYGVLLHAYENRHKIYAMEGLLGEVDNHGCDRLGKQVITCLKDMAVARGLDPTIVDDIKKGRAASRAKAKSEARSLSGSETGSKKRRSNGLGFPTVSGRRGGKHQKIMSLPVNMGREEKKTDDSDAHGKGQERKGKGRMCDIEVIELVDSDDAAVGMNMDEEELD